MWVAVARAQRRGGDCTAAHAPVAQLLTAHVHVHVQRGPCGATHQELQPPGCQQWLLRGAAARRLQSALWPASHKVSGAGAGGGGHWGGRARARAPCNACTLALSFHEGVNLPMDAGAGAAARGERPDRASTAPPWRVHAWRLAGRHTHDASPLSAPRSAALWTWPRFEPAGNASSRCQGAAWLAGPFVPTAHMAAFTACVKLLSRPVVVFTC